MNLNKREFLQVLAAGAAAGMSLDTWANNQSDDKTAGDALYDIAPFGNVSFLHMTDCHAQLNPVYFREPNVNIGVGNMRGNPPHLVGEQLLQFVKVRPNTLEAHALTYLNYATAAQRYGKVGGFAHLATLIKHLKISRPGALLLDGGDTWQGSATALWTNAQDMVRACQQLGVDIMTGHWEFTYGMDRVNQVVHNDFKGNIEFVAQNIKTADFEDPVFPSYSWREINGVPCAVIGQAFPYTPIAHPRYMVPEWRFGIREENLQTVINDVRTKGAQVVVLLSHNGMDVDLKLASRVRGLDAIMGGHTHDGVPVARVIPNPGGQTLVTNGGSNGKFLGVLDFQVKNKKVQDYRYRLLPVFSSLLPADPQMQALIDEARAPYISKLDEQLAVSEGLLYRRGNFNGNGDQLLVDALMEVQDAPIAFSPGFRWGTSLLPGQAITREWIMNMTATTYSFATVTQMSGQTIKTILEDVCDNLFNPDPYYQQGGDMVRVGGLTYTCTPNADAGKRISDMRLNGRPIAADKNYKVAGWAPVSEQAREQDLPMMWDIVETWLKNHPRLPALQPNQPELLGIAGNPGYASLNQ